MRHLRGRASHSQQTATSEWGLSLAVVAVAPSLCSPRCHRHNVRCSTHSLTQRERECVCVWVCAVRAYDLILALLLT